MARKNRGGVKSRGAPILATLEQTAVTTADTAVNANLYAPPSGTTNAMQRWTFNLRSVQCTVTDGGTACRTYAVVRRVPAGYSAPAMSVGNSVTTFADVPNVLAYGTYSTADVRENISWRWLKRATYVYPGDAIVIQFVVDTSSTGHAISTLAEYDVY